MRKIFYYLSVSMFVMTVAYLMTGCKDNNDPDTPPKIESTFSAKLKEVTSTTAEITLSTVRITEAAYLTLKKGETAPDAAIIFAKGTRNISCTNGETTVTIRDLEPLTDYVIYFAGIVADTEEYCKDIAAVDVSTGDFEDEISVYDVDYDGFKLRLKVPDSLAANNHVIKWTLSDVLTQKTQSYGLPDAITLGLNDEYYGNYVKESTTFTFDNDHSYVLDDQGNHKIDEDTGEEIYYYDPIVPGGKYIVTFGEFAYGENEEYFSGWGEGYYQPLFKMDEFMQDQWENPEVKEADYWTGFYHKIEVSTKVPEKLDASLKIEKNLRPNGGQVSFTPDEKIKRYLYCFTDDMTYNQALQMFLDNDPNNMQWAMTSLWAMYNLGVMWAEEPVDVSLGDILYLDKEATYHIFAVGMGDERGTSQCFYHETFTLPDPTKPAPEVTVTAIDNPNGDESPYEVWFNVKCTTKDAFTGKYAANYKREWESALNGGYQTEADLIGSGYDLSSEEIDKINSEEGLNMSFNSREDAVTYLGVIAYNDEGTASEPSVANKRTIPEPAATPVSSELFTSLLGEWTATATVQYQEYDYNTFTYTTDTTTLKSKVTIGDVICKATLPEEIYQYYYDNTKYKTKKEVDSVYNDLKAAVDVFNKKTKNQNRLLCQGLDLEVPQNEYAGSNTQYASPYDLFISKSYNGPDNEAIVWDFGPKWYLQIAADGSVSVPFNSNRLAPLTAWGQNAYYIVGVSETAALPYVMKDGKPDTGNFPVTVSEDKNTITINSLTYNNDTYYPGLGYAGYGQWSFPSRIISSIVLTRGWSGDTESAMLTSAHGTKTPKIGGPVGMTSYYTVKTANRPKSRTVIPAAPTVKRKNVKTQITTLEKFEDNIRAYKQKIHSNQ